VSRSVAISALLVGLACSSVNAQAPATAPVWVQGGPYRLKTSVYRSSGLSPHPALLVVLHGDAPFNKPDYQDTFAAKVAAGYSDVIAAAILRPGYTDPQGNTSEGDRGLATGDNYNAQNVDALAAAISELRRRFKARRVVMVGHSGGAAITANILGRHPALVDAALLVSCPCDVKRWRAHMFQKTGIPTFQGLIATLSPIDLVSGIADRTTISMIVGAKDDVAPPDLSEAYRSALARLGKHVQLTELKDQGHEILLNPVVLQTVAPLLH
jgi:pimeloyl-ACP methyl ester carboxylesterase